MVYFAMRDLRRLPLQFPLVDDLEESKQPCVLNAMAHSVSAKRYVEWRVLTDGEISRKKLRVEPIAAETSLKLLRGLESVCSMIRLDMSDLLGGEPGAGFDFAVDAVCPPGELVPSADTTVELDFAPRDANSDGSGTGKWAYFVDLVEEYKERSDKDVTSAVRLERRGVAKSVACKLRTIMSQAVLQSPNANAGLDDMLNLLLFTAASVRIRATKKKGRKKNGVTTNSFIVSLERTVRMGETLPYFLIPVCWINRDVPYDEMDHAYRVRSRASSYHADVNPDSHFAVPLSEDNANTGGVGSFLRANDSYNPTSFTAAIDTATGEKVGRALRHLRVTLSGRDKESENYIKDACAPGNLTPEGRLVQTYAYTPANKSIGARSPTEWRASHKPSLAEMQPEARDALLSKDHVLLEIGSVYCFDLLLLELMHSIAKAKCPLLALPEMTHMLDSADDALEDAGVYTEAVLHLHSAGDQVRGEYNCDLIVEEARAVSEALLAMPEFCAFASEEAPWEKLCQTVMDRAMIEIETDFSHRGCNVAYVDFGDICSPRICIEKKDGVSRVKRGSGTVYGTTFHVKLREKSMDSHESAMERARDADWSTDCESVVSDSDAEEQDVEGEQDGLRTDRMEGVELDPADDDDAE
eukprot:3298037-Prymnesium_polylepis.3